MQKIIIHNFGPIKECEMAKIRIYSKKISPTDIELIIDLSENIDELVERYADRDISFWAIYENSQQLNYELENLFDLPYPT